MGFKSWTKNMLEGQARDPFTGEVTSTYLGNRASGDYVEVEENGNVVFHGNAAAWRDITVDAGAADVVGATYPKYRRLGRDAAGEDFSFVFNGYDESGSIPAGSDLTFNDADYSIAFWFQPDANISATGTLLHKDTAYEIDINGENVEVLLYDKTAPVVAPFLNGSRNHVVVSVEAVNSNRTRCRLYINDDLVDQRTYNGSGVQDADDIIYLGSLSGSGNFYKGKIDDLRIYDSRLSNSDIEDLYNLGYGTSASLGTEIGHWKFNESTDYYSENFGSVGRVYDVTGSTDTLWSTGLILSSGSVSYSPGLYLRMFAPDEEQSLWFDKQINHDWKYDSVLHPHIHCIGNGSPLGSGDVVFGLEYIWFNIDEGLPEATIIYASGTIADLTHSLIEFDPKIDGTGKTLSSMHVCRLFRDVNNVNDTYDGYVGYLEFDWHGQFDRIGSDDEYVR